jgi:hypothetical protein
MEIVELKLTVNKVNIILSALGKQPYESVFQLIAEIINEVQNQLKKDENPIQVPNS